MDYKEKVIALLNSKELTKEQKEKLDEIFPELKESEDERIRKAIITYLKQRRDRSSSIPAAIGSWIAWLEKQGEQKPAVWSEEDEKCLKHAIEDFQKLGDSYLTSWLKSLKDRVQPKQEWSDEDESKIRHLIAFLDTNPNSVIYSRPKEEWIDWLKSLRPQNTWKPSKEQMNTLEYYLHTLVCNEHKEILFGLYTDLKKLREE